MSTTVPKLLWDDKSRKVGTFAHYFRLPEPLLKFLASKIAPHIQKENTNIRQAIDVQTKLRYTLRCLATSTSKVNLHYKFKLGLFMKMYNDIHVHYNLQYLITKLQNISYIN